MTAINIPIDDLTEIKEEMSRAENMLNRIMTAQLEESLSPCDFEYNMQHLASWLDDKQKQIQELLDANSDKEEK